MSLSGKYWQSTVSDKRRSVSRIRDQEEAETPCKKATFNNTGSPPIKCNNNATSPPSRCSMQLRDPSMRKPARHKMDFLEDYQVPHKATELSSELNTPFKNKRKAVFKTPPKISKSHKSYKTIDDPETVNAPPKKVKSWEEHLDTISLSAGIPTSKPREKKCEPPKLLHYMQETTKKIVERIQKSPPQLTSEVILTRGKKMKMKSTSSTTSMDKKQRVWVAKKRNYAQKLTKDKRRTYKRFSTSKPTHFGQRRRYNTMKKNKTLRDNKMKLKLVKTREEEHMLPKVPTSKKKEDDLTIVPSSLDVESENQIYNVIYSSTESLTENSNSDSDFKDVDGWSDDNDDLFQEPKRISTGKEEVEIVEDVELLTFKTEEDMLEFTNIEMDHIYAPPPLSCDDRILDHHLTDWSTPSDDIYTPTGDIYTPTDDSILTDGHTPTREIGFVSTIIPTKTNDITKIKGWRSKKFVSDGTIGYATSSSPNFKTQFYSPDLESGASCSRELSPETFVSKKPSIMGPSCVSNVFYSSEDEMEDHSDLMKISAPKSDEVKDSKQFNSVAMKPSSDLDEKWVNFAVSALVPPTTSKVSQCSVTSKNPQKKVKKPMSQHDKLVKARAYRRYNALRRKAEKSKQKMEQISKVELKSNPAPVDQPTEETRTKHPLARGVKIVMEHLLLEVEKELEGREIVETVKRPTKRKEMWAKRELRRLGHSVIDMDESEEEAENHSTGPFSVCENDFCRLGCVCESLDRSNIPQSHCGKVECMFECHCRINGVPTASAMEKILEDTNKDLAPIEKHFHNTVIKSDKGLIVVREKRRRAIKVPERFRDDMLTGDALSAWEMSCNVLRNVGKAASSKNHSQNTKSSPQLLSEATSQKTEVPVVSPRKRKSLLQQRRTSFETETTATCEPQISSLSASDYVNIPSPEILVAPPHNESTEYRAEAYEIECEDFLIDIANQESIKQEFTAFDDKDDIELDDIGWESLQEIPLSPKRPENDDGSGCPRIISVTSLAPEEFNSMGKEKENSSSSAGPEEDNQPETSSYSCDYDIDPEIQNMLKSPVSFMVNNPSTSILRKVAKQRAKRLAKFFTEHSSNVSTLVKSALEFDPDNHKIDVIVLLQWSSFKHRFILGSINIWLKDNSRDVQFLVTSSDEYQPEGYTNILVLENPPDVVQQLKEPLTNKLDYLRCCILWCNGSEWEFIGTLMKRPEIRGALPSTKEWNPIILPLNFSCHYKYGLPQDSSETKWYTVFMNKDFLDLQLKNENVELPSEELLKIISLACGHKMAIYLPVTRSSNVHSFSVPFGIYATVKGDLKVYVGPYQSFEHPVIELVPCEDMVCTSSIEAMILEALPSTDEFINVDSQHLASEMMNQRPLRKKRGRTWNRIDIKEREVREVASENSELLVEECGSPPPPDMSEKSVRLVQRTTRNDMFAKLVCNTSSIAPIPVLFLSDGSVRLKNPLGTTIIHFSNLDLTKNYLAYTFRDIAVKYNKVLSWNLSTWKVGTLNNPDLQVIDKSLRSAKVPITSHMDLEMCIGRIEQPRARLGEQKQNHRDLESQRRRDLMLRFRLLASLLLPDNMVTRSSKITVLNQAKMEIDRLQKLERIRLAEKRLVEKKRDKMFTHFSKVIEDLPRAEKCKAIEQLRSMFETHYVESRDYHKPQEINLASEDEDNLEVLDDESELAYDSDDDYQLPSNSIKISEKSSNSSVEFINAPAQDPGPINAAIVLPSLEKKRNQTLSPDSVDSQSSPALARNNILTPSPPPLTPAPKYQTVPLHTLVTKNTKHLAGTHVQVNLCDPNSNKSTKSIAVMYSGNCNETPCPPLHFGPVNDQNKFPDLRPYPSSSLLVASSKPAMKSSGVRKITTQDVPGLIHTEDLVRISLNGKIYYNKKPLKKGLKKQCNKSVNKATPLENLIPNSSDSGAATFVNNAEQIFASVLIPSGPENSSVNRPSRTPSCSSDGTSSRTSSPDLVVLSDTEDKNFSESSKNGIKPIAKKRKSDQTFITNTVSLPDSTKRLKGHLCVMDTVIEPVTKFRSTDKDNPASNQVPLTDQITISTMGSSRTTESASASVSYSTEPVSQECNPGKVFSNSSEHTITVVENSDNFKQQNSVAKTPNFTLIKVKRKLSAKIFKQAVRHKAPEPTWMIPKQKRLELQTSVNSRLPIGNPPKNEALHKSHPSTKVTNHKTDVSTSCDDSIQRKILLIPGNTSQFASIGNISQGAAVDSFKTSLSSNFQVSMSSKTATTNSPSSNPGVAPPNVMKNFIRIPNATIRQTYFVCPKIQATKEHTSTLVASTKVSDSISTSITSPNLASTGVAGSSRPPPLIVISPNSMSVTNNGNECKEQDQTGSSHGPSVVLHETFSSSGVID